MKEKKAPTDCHCDTVLMSDLRFEILHKKNSIRLKLENKCWTFDVHKVNFL